MKLVAGLGNPEEKYERTRHNAGFRAVELFAERHGLPPFTEEKKHRAEISKGRAAGADVLLVKPLTYMNRSGEAVSSLSSFHKIPQEAIVIVHDDIDISLGQIKISRGQGAGGHRGVESVIQKLGGKDFWRVRVGILPATGKPSDPEGFVLRRFTPEEQDPLEESLQDASDAICYLLQDRAEEARKRFHTA